MFGLLVVALGLARLYWAKSVRDTTLPWQRHRHHEKDLEGRGEPFDEATQGVVLGIVFIAVGLLILVVFSVVPALR